MSWPKTADGYSVQRTADLGAPQWQAETGTPTVEGEENVLVVSPTGTTFYRLTK